MIYYITYTNWEGNIGRSSSNLNLSATLLGFIAAFIVGLYIFFSEF